MKGFELVLTHFETEEKGNLEITYCSINKYLLSDH